LESVFLLVYHQNHQVLKETGALKKRERNSIEEKEEGKEKLQESLEIKRGSQYFERRKTSQL
jgi:hypothetical protein